MKKIMGIYIRVSPRKYRLVHGVVSIIVPELSLRPSFLGGVEMALVAVPLNSHENMGQSMDVHSTQVMNVQKNVEVTQLPVKIYGTHPILKQTVGNLQECVTQD